VFDERVGTTAKLPELTTEGALRDDVTAATATAVDAARAAVIRVLDEHDAYLVHLLNRTNNNSNNNNTASILGVKVSQLTGLKLAQTSSPQYHCYML